MNILKCRKIIFHTKTIFLALLLLIFLSPSQAWSDWQDDLIDYIEDSVFTPGKAYYPTVIYDEGGFGHGEYGPFYKMWYTGNAGIDITTSDDGINWNIEANCTGLKNPHHARVVYDENGFGNGISGPFYKIWYWDTSQLYSINAIRSAESDDGITWTNDQAITQDAIKQLITGIWPDWNRGSYGPTFVFYFPNASNTGGDPFDYSFAMYFDGTTGGFEQVGLAYSTNGYQWEMYGTDPVLPSGRDPAEGWGLPDPWDSSYVGFGTVIIDEAGKFHFWYSGGTEKMHKGIGYASSDDGINWTKDANNPFIECVAGSWHEDRAYTPSVIYDTNRFSGHGFNTEYKMWFTGQDTNDKRVIGMFGQPIATLSIERKSQLPTIEWGDETSIVSLITLDFSNDDVEDISISTLKITLQGTLTNSVEKLSLYLDTDENGEINDGDTLIDSVTPSGDQIEFSITQPLNQSSSQSFLIAAWVPTGTSGTIQAILNSENDIEGEGNDSLQIVISGAFPIRGDVIAVKYDENNASEPMPQERTDKGSTTNEPQSTPEDGEIGTNEEGSMDNQPPIVTFDYNALGGSACSLNPSATNPVGLLIIAAGFIFLSIRRIYYKRK